MIKFENTEVVGWEHAIRGMRNPMNSWDKSDSFLCDDYSTETGECSSTCPRFIHCNSTGTFSVGTKDLDLMQRLRSAGTDHRKYLRMITVYVDITAPLYWWKEFDTYKVGTVANSCSTMHKIAAKEFTYEDFSCEHIGNVPNCDPWYQNALDATIGALNEARHCYLDTKDKKYWWQMIQLLPSSYNQKRTVMLNYEVLNNIYKSRSNHKLDEWSYHEGIIDGNKTNKRYIGFCDWIETLPYANELIIGK